MMRNYQEKTTKKKIQQQTNKQTKQRGQEHCKYRVQQEQNVLQLKNLGAFMNYNASQCGWSLVSKEQQVGTEPAGWQSYTWSLDGKFNGKLLKLPTARDLVSLI